MEGKNFIEGMKAKIFLVTTFNKKRHESDSQVGLQNKNLTWISLKLNEILVILRRINILLLIQN